MLVTYALFLILEDVDQADLGRQPVLRVGAVRPVRQRRTLGVQIYVGYDFALVALAVVVRRRASGGA